MNMKSELLLSSFPAQLFAANELNDIEDDHLKLYLQKFDDSFSFGMKWWKGRMLTYLIV